LDNAKQIFETYGDIPWVHWAPYEETYLCRYAGRFGDLGGCKADRPELIQLAYPHTANSQYFITIHANGPAMQRPAAIARNT